MSVVDPRKLRLRVVVLRPTNEKNLTGNTKGRFATYATRYAGKEEVGGQSTNVDEQDQATRRVNWFMRTDASIKPSWVLRYNSEDYYVDAIVSLDPKDRYSKLLTEKLETLVTVDP
jgi:head-tail adaptor